MYNVVWSETALSDDNRSHYGVATLVNLAMDHAELGCVHRNGFEQLPTDAQGAIVVIHGAHQARDFQSIVHRLNRLSWSVVIVIGDEGALFPTEQLAGGRRKIWVQMPVPGRHDAFRKLVCGYPHDAPAYLAHYQNLPRRYVWSYSGQISHRLRQECVSQLGGMQNGFLLTTPGFWQGLPRDEYYKVMAESMFVACPSGSCTPDTLRVFEALEAGAIPVADDRFPPNYPRGSSGGQTGYWKYVLGDVPFPTLTNWAEFPRIIQEWLPDYEQHRENLQYWWKDYKNSMSTWLEEDVKWVMS